MGCDIYLANKDKTKVLQLPIIPAELPDKTKSISNEEFATYDNGTFNFIKKAGLDTLTLDSWLPVKDYSFQKSSVKAKDVISLIDDAIDNKEYIQAVFINPDGSTYINDKFSIEAWNYKVQRNGTYLYSLGLKQFRECPKESYVLGWNLDSTGWKYCINVETCECYHSGWQKVSGDTEWYYFNANGYALYNQWLLYKNKWYWLRSNCQMKHSGWEQIKGLWYYFYNDGSMACNTTTPDGYKVNSSGAWVK